MVLIALLFVSAASAQEQECERPSGTAAELIELYNYIASVASADPPIRVGRCGHGDYDGDGNIGMMDLLIVGNEARAAIAREKAANPEVELELQELPSHFFLGMTQDTQGLGGSADVEWGLYDENANFVADFETIGSITLNQQGALEFYSFVGPLSGLIRGVDNDGLEVIFEIDPNYVHDINNKGVVVVFSSNRDVPAN